MTKKIRKKRKISPIKKSLRKKNLARNFIVLLSLIFILLLFAYFFLSKNNQVVKPSEKNNILQSQKTYSNDEVMEEVLKNIYPNSKDNILEKKDDEKLEFEKDIKKEVLEKQKEIESSKKVEKTIEQKPTKEIEEEIIEDKKELKEAKTSEKYPIVTKKDSYKYDLQAKPKLVIIIDDVVSKSQKDKILNIGYPINISFLPPTNEHKESAQIAQNLPFYMIHFPMQASKNFKNSEVDTLNISHSYEKIEERVKKLRDWYPNATYTNNHTGSVFTENYESMDMLFRALKKYNFIFVDSKTTPNSVAKELSVKYQMPYIVRDTFLDNDRNFTAIQNQLKDAIKVAKKDGYAVAIGHPYDITIKVLKESKHLLNDVEPIFLNKLPYL
ncbi:hypothetical protein CRU87_04005 [Aliarcobacter trophiarum LMG 25534]|uniref:Divergent polysaccharide deacetylase n=1 Tax=Aliarcobacter trophiarum LMG 25534 TaxID=1032241 RepID=A0AAD0QLN6_9BACT|nr:divergent polysaccharide deacetylase family protein [Aliarcobacter trophiarum]AXK49598.1 divergent polysaccharide deacetylase [Aliarcobacter trophiarum LMG 25534]RXJ92271.1 hypothetical protein CRU87_04005 [Aliarcobacter trophiarum LMG 25534]